MNDARQHMSWASRLRFLTRVLGITAVLVGVGGAFYLSTLLPLSSWNAESISQAAKNGLGMKAMIGAWLMLIGALVAFVALVVECVTGLTSGASSRGGAGVNAALQIVLAIGILGAVNAYAFLHEVDIDATRNKEFTLPTDVVAELQKLKTDTTIVVLQQHKTFGRLSDKPDRFDYAAERKVVEKVLDTVDLLRKLGSQFKVVVLDVEEEGYDKKFLAVTEDKPALREAIRSAPENSIFFYSEGHVQRMGFNEFYLLDKSESKQGNGNLVLRPQGLDGFVKRISAIEEKRPKVALLSMHHVLSSETDQGQEVLSLAGMRKSLEENGFEVVDLILKKNHRPAEQFDGDPAAFSLDESKLQRTEEDFSNTETSIRADNAYLKKLLDIKKRCEEVKSEPIKKRNSVYREFSKAVLGGQLPRDLTEDEEPGFLAELERRIGQAQQEIADDRQEHGDLESKLKNLRRQERAVEDRRLDDVKAKFTRLLEDCDLVVVPRITIMNATNEEKIPYGVQKFKDVHIEVLKKFVKAGKPMLVCTGPVSEQENEPPAIFDDLEKMLQDRGIELGKQTILFDSEKKAFSARTAGSLLGGSDVPPVSFEPPDLPKGKKLNPLGATMLAVQHSVDEKLNIKLRAPRPINVSPDMQASLRYYAEFMWTAPNCWNEMFPFPEYRPMRTPAGIVMEPVYIPRFDPVAGKEGKNKDEERRGPFSIGVAIESNPPHSWDESANPFEIGNDGLIKKKSDAADEPATPTRASRLVVIGQGGAFVGTDLKPATERLLLNTCNWLLMRDDRLPQTNDSAWRYPRVEMSDGHKRMWHWGTFIGLPAFFIYLGLVVLMIRRIR